MHADSIKVTSSWRLTSPAFRLFVQQLVKNNEGNIKARYYWSFVRQIHAHKNSVNQVMRKAFSCHDVIICQDNSSMDTTNTSLDLLKQLTYIDGLVQVCNNSSALAMELQQSCTKPSICFLQILTTCEIHVYSEDSIKWTHLTHLSNTSWILKRLQQTC